MIPLSMKEDSFHPVLRLAAKFISIIFHPLFIPVYMGWFFIHEVRLFPEQDDWHQTLLLIQFFVNYTLLPLVTLLLAKGLGFIDNVYLRNQRDRIIPYIATGVFYFWVWYVFKNQHYPDQVVMFAFAVFLASSLGLILNIYFKVSMHMLAMGVVSTLMLISALHSEMDYGVYLSIAFLTAGLVGTCRLITKDHHPFDVYAGFLAGMLCQVVAYFVVS